MSLKASVVFYLTGLFCSFYNSVWTGRILNTPWLFTQLNRDRRALLRTSVLHNCGFKAKAGDQAVCSYSHITAES